jgi:hypothetical protein
VSEYRAPVTVTDPWPQLRQALAEHPQTAFSEGEIAEVEKEWDDGTDEPEFAWLIRLKDGRYVAAHGGHDYTGWDCQSHLESTVHPTREEAIRMGLTLNEREHLGLLLPGEGAQP